MYHIHNPLRKAITIESTFGPLTCQPAAPGVSTFKQDCISGITLDEIQAILGESNDGACDPTKMSYCFEGAIFIRNGNFRAISVSLWDWKGSSEHGVWSLWAGGSIYEMEIWKAYIRGALVLLHEAQEGARGDWQEAKDIDDMQHTPDH